MTEPTTQPDPAQPTLPADAPIVLYDGVCGFCNRSVQFVLRHDRRGVFRFASLQSDAGQALLRQHGLRTDDFDTFVLVEGGRAHLRTRGVRRVIRRLRAPWPALARAMALVPPPVADFFYDQLAKRRYRIFGKLDACMLPPPEVRARFLS